MVGTSETGYGVSGDGEGASVSRDDVPSNGGGVAGASATGTGVMGKSNSGDGVFGTGRRGVVGVSQTYQGVFGKSGDNAGVVGESDRMHAVFGITHSTLSPTHAGVYGASTAGGRGVMGESQKFQGVYGKSGDNAGVVGESDKFHAVFGITHSTFAGVYGASTAGGTGVAGESTTGIGVHGKGGKLAGFFEGDVEVTGDIRLANAADCAEDFDVSGAVKVEPGTVMILGNDGALSESQQAYDKRVAGVISARAATTRASC